MSRSNSREVFEVAWKKSLDNAKHLLADADSLMNSKSYGHAIALAISSDEELAKAYVCWLAAKELIPENSKDVRDVFSRHDKKHLAQISVQSGLHLREELEQGKVSWKNIFNYGIGLTEEQLKRDVSKLQQISKLQESLRQHAVYVDTKGDSQVHSPSDYSHEEAARIISASQRLDHQGNLMINPTLEQLAFLKTMLNCIPREAFAKGVIPLSWFTSWKADPRLKRLKRLVESQK